MNIRCSCWNIGLLIGAILMACSPTAAAAPGPAHEVRSPDGKVAITIHTDAPLGYSITVDGKPVLFYARRPLAAPVPVRKPKKAAAANDDRQADLIDGLKGLGAVNVTAAQVAEAVKELYPNGASGVPQGELLRAVFLHLRRRNTSDNVRR